MFAVCAAITLALPTRACTPCDAFCPCAAMLRLRSDGWLQLRCCVALRARALAERENRGPVAWLW